MKARLKLRFIPNRHDLREPEVRTFTDQDFEVDLFRFPPGQLRAPMPLFKESKFASLQLVALDVLVLFEAL